MPPPKQFPGSALDKQRQIDIVRCPCLCSCRADKNATWETAFHGMWLVIRVGDLLSCPEQHRSHYPYHSKSLLLCIVYFHVKNNVTTNTCTRALTVLQPLLLALGLLKILTLYRVVCAPCIFRENWLGHLGLDSRWQWHHATRKLCYRKDDRAMRMGALKILGTPDYAHGYCSQHFSCAYVRITLWMFPQNLKSVALPVPEIIGGTQKMWAVPGYAHAYFFSKIFNGLLFRLAL